MCFFGNSPFDSRETRYPRTFEVYSSSNFSALESASRSPRHTAIPRPSRPRRSQLFTYASRSWAYIWSGSIQYRSATRTSRASGATCCSTSRAAKIDVSFRRPPASRSRTLVEDEGKEPRRRRAAHFPRPVDAEEVGIHVGNRLGVADRLVVVQHDDRIRQAFEEIELAGSHIAHDQELVRFLPEAGRGRPIEGVRHGRVDSLAPAHQGPGQNRSGGRAVRIVMAEDADPGRVVDEIRGPPGPTEQALGRQIVQALDHGPPTSLAAPRASRRNPSLPAGRRVTCNIGIAGGFVPRSTRGRAGYSGLSDGP